MSNSTLRTIILTVIILGCAREPGYEKSQFVRNKEAREDSLKLAQAYNFMNQVEARVYPLVETRPVASQEGEDAADDPAFWYNQQDPGSSLIFGTNKKGGIYAYSLDGQEVAYYPIGLINNIDVRQQVMVGNQTIDILGGSNRSDNSVVLYEIRQDGSLQSLLQQNHQFDTTDINEVYGFCLYKSSQQGFVVVNGKNGRIRVLEISHQGQKVKLQPGLSWDLTTQPEGMVADDGNSVLYVGEEENGIWKVPLYSDSRPEIIPSSQKINNPHIEYDIEGLALYKDPSGDHSKGFLLASIQGSFSFAVFERSGSNQYLTSFKITGTGDIDGVEETDGLEIFPASLNHTFPQGVLVVQDGFNYRGEAMENQNFKVIPLEQVLELLKTPVLHP